MSIFRWQKTKKIVFISSIISKGNTFKNYGLKHGMDAWEIMVWKLSFVFQQKPKGIISNLFGFKHNESNIHFLIFSLKKKKKMRRRMKLINLFITKGRQKNCRHYLVEMRNNGPYRGSTLHFKRYKHLWQRAIWTKQRTKSRAFIWIHSLSHRTIWLVQVFIMNLLPERRWS